MRKGREIRNLPVIQAENGTILGVVSDFLIADDHRLDGLLFQNGEKKTCFIPLERIESIGRDAVFVNGEAGEFGSAAGPDNSCGKGKRSLGSLVITADGKSLGTVGDILLDGDEGRIVGYEVSDGHLLDILVGRRVVEATSVITYSDDAVIVDGNFE